MYFQKHQDLKLGVHGAVSTESATSGRPGPLQRSLTLVLLRMLPDGFLVTFPR